MKKFFSLLMPIIILSSFIPAFAYVEHCMHGGMAVGASQRYRVHHRMPPPPPPPPSVMRRHHPIGAVYYSNNIDGYDPMRYCKFRATYNPSYCPAYAGYRNSGAGFYVNF